MLLINAKDSVITLPGALLSHFLPTNSLPAVCGVIHRFLKCHLILYFRFVVNMYEDTGATKSKFLSKVREPKWDK